MSNVILNPGAGGATLGTDTVGGVDYQKVKVTFSTDGSVPVSVDSTHGLPVAQVSASGVAASYGTGITDTGTQRVVLATDQPSLTNAVPVLQSGTWTVTTTPPANASTNVTQVASTALGVPQTFGTAPTGVVIGTSSDLYVAGTRARSNQTTTAAGVQDVNIVGTLGVTNSVTNGTFAAITDNVTKVGVIATTTALKTDMSSVAGTATSTAAAGVQKVGVVGNTGATLDAANGSAVPTNGVLAGGGSVAGGTNFTALTVKAASTAAAATDTSLVVQPLVGSHVMNTAAAGTQLVGVVGSAAAVLDSVTTVATTPANAVAVSVANVTTAPSLATGQSVAMQGDYQGSVFVKPYRRGQTTSKATTIAATGATTVLAAQAAGIFADISSLVISVTPQATTASSFTFTLSDGTNSYIFDLIAQVTTANGTTPPLVITFNPPLPAATAATAWTGNISATNTVHVTVVAALQKAS